MNAQLRRIDPGQTFVWGKTTEMARLLLDSADAIGVQPIEVRAVGHGFIVPDAVWDHAAHAAVPATDHEEF